MKNCVLRTASKHACMSRCRRCARSLGADMPTLRPYCVAHTARLSSHAHWTFAWNTWHIHYMPMLKCLFALIHTD
eukprot:344517-Chlamydomonas_euryale.AAC.16